MGISLSSLLVLACAAGVLGDSGGDEIIVTASMRTSTDSRITAPEPTPPAAVQRLVRRADFAVLQVLLISDTEDADKADGEVRAMTAKALDFAATMGIELGHGALVVTPVTKENAKSLEISEIEIERDYPLNDLEGRGARIWVKVPLKPGVDGAMARGRIDAFVKRAPMVGRAQMEPLGELNLSVVNPEQYRGAIIDLVVADNQATRAKFGADYGIRVTGLDRPVQWMRAGLTDVQLYLPVNATISNRD